MTKILDDKFDNVINTVNRGNPRNFFTSSSSSNFRTLYYNITPINLSIDDILDKIKIICIYTSYYILKKFYGYGNYHTLYGELIDDDFKKYLKMDNFEYISTDYSVLNFLFINDICFEDKNTPSVDINRNVKIDRIKINISENVFTAFSPVVINFKYNDKIYHIFTLITTDSGYANSSLLPLFKYIKDSEYRKFREIISKPEYDMFK